MQIGTNKRLEKRPARSLTKSLESQEEERASTVRRTINSRMAGVAA